MRIAVYSGTFDPLHIGHLAILHRLQDSGRFDAIYLIVSPQSPFKGAERADNAVSRLEAARKAVARHPELTVKVDDIELMMPSPQYTIRTLDALKARETGNEFILVTGADQLASFEAWQDYRRILSEYGIVVFPRDGYDCRADKEALEKKAALEGWPCNIEVVDAPLVNISSTFIRESLLKGEDVSRFLM